MSKWNYTTHKYEPYWIPDSANIVLFSNNLGDIAQCACCLQPERIGFMYASKTIHIDGGERRE